MDTRRWDVIFRWDDMHSGGYPILQCGQVAEFAVEVWTDEDDDFAAVPPGVEPKPGSAPLGRGWHAVTGEVVYQTDNAEAAIPFPEDWSFDEGYVPEGLFVLDFGIPGYTTYDPELVSHPAPGTWLTGRALLSVDPHPYVEWYAGLPGIPPLVYTWRIERIRLMTRAECRDVEATDIVPQFGVGAPPTPTYLLTAQLMDAPPRFASATGSCSKWAEKENP